MTADFDQFYGDWREVDACPCGHIRHNGRLGGDSFIVAGDQRIGLRWQVHCPKCGRHKNEVRQQVGRPVYRERKVPWWSMEAIENLWGRLYPDEVGWQFLDEKAQT